MEKSADVINRNTFVEELFSAYCEKITKIAAAHISRHYPRSGIHIDDLVQEAFIQALRYAGTLSGHPNVCG